MDLLAAPPWPPGNRVTSARKDSPEKYREPDLSQPGSSYEKGNLARSKIPFKLCDGAPQVVLCGVPQGAHSLRELGAEGGI